MRYRNKILIAAVSMAAVALAGPVAAETKIGFVDLAKLSENAPQIIEAQNKIDAEFSSREKELVSLQRKLAKLEETLSTDGDVMSTSERSKKEHEILGMRRDLKRSQEEFRDDLNIRRNDVLKKLQIDVFEAVTAFAKEQNYDLILSQGVVYSSDRIDVTEGVLKKLSK